MRHGLSLVEVAIAFLILALVPALSVMSSASRQAAQTAEYSLALALEQEVADELRAGVWENVHLPGTLAADPSFSVPLPIADGISPVDHSRFARIAARVRCRSQCARNSARSRIFVTYTSAVTG